MIPAKGYAAQTATTPLAPFQFDRREVGTMDVLIDILYCGVCHSDIHQSRDEWGGSIFPMVPGHEIVGRVGKVGSGVKGFKVGDLAGVGCYVDSCRTCSNCKSHMEQYCEKGMNATYNGYEKDGKTPTYGGYSSQIVVDENYTLHIGSNLQLERVGPLLCAGITTYSPIMHWKIGTGHRVGVVGLGGLGHMAVKFAVALGSEVTVLSTSKNKEPDAKKLGAHSFAYTGDEKVFKSLRNHFDFIIDAVSAPHEVNRFLKMLRTDGTMVVVGVPPTPSSIEHSTLIGNRRSLGGSLIGGIKETQEMLDFCSERNIMSDVEVIAMKDINTAYERMMKNDVKYRFVIDMATLKALCVLATSR
jgi:uncharacterized zinc-type alcohol dehydrogenase-like protein